MCTEGVPLADGVERFGPGMTRPRLVHFRPPSVAEEPDPRAAGQHLRTVFRCVITREGRPEHCCVVEEVTRAVTKSFLWVMPDWRYEPATVDGRPVRVEYTVVVALDNGPLLGKSLRAQPPGGH
jgi:hypothetical protein